MSDAGTLNPMFTGIVEGMGRLERLTSETGTTRLIVDPGEWSVRPQVGQSVCVSGVCLTVVPNRPGDEPAEMLAFDVVRETLDRTTLGRLTAGSRVNLEPSLMADTPLGGHFVQGHVDGVGTVTKLIEGDERRIAVRPPGELLNCIVPKGSIAIDGVSLTLASVSDDEFDAALIPQTLRATTLGSVSEGDPVNLETDIISKSVVHWLNRRQAAESVTIDTLRKAGFAAPSADQ